MAFFRFSSNNTIYDIGSIPWKIFIEGNLLVETEILSLDQLRDRKKSFRNFFLILLPTGLHSPGPHELIALYIVILGQNRNQLRKACSLSNFASDQSTIDS